MDSGQVQSMIDSMQVNMSNALRLEFAATLTEVDRRLSDVQNRMSMDLRAEFGKTTADFTDRLDNFAQTIDKSVTEKFDGADEAFRTERQVQKEIIEKLETAWNGVSNSQLKDVSDAPPVVEPGFKEEAGRARALSSNR